MKSKNTLTVPAFNPSLTFKSLTSPQASKKV
jgi:hypothetical protein